MKKIISILAICLLLANLSFSQTTAGKNPVKKVVTSKITKDPKTGKITKTVTTTIIKDIVLSEGNLPVKKAIASSKVVQKKKVIVKSPTKIAAKTSTPAASKPKVVAVAKSETKVVTEQKFVTATEPLNKEAKESIFANPNDNSAKSDVNMISKQNTTTAKPIVNTPSKKPTKIFKEGSKKAARYYVGLRGGLNLATVENAIYLSQIGTATESKRLGINGGLLLNIAFSKTFSLQPEVNYSDQGYKVSNGVNSEEIANKAINIPVLLKFAVGNNDVKFFVNGGPYVGYLFRSKKMNYFGNTYVETLVDFKEDATKEISTNRFDYGMQAGAGLQINLGGPKLELEARYQYGLADPIVYSATKPSYLGDIGRNRIMTGTAALLFPINK